MLLEAFEASNAQALEVPQDVRTLKEKLKERFRVATIAARKKQKEEDEERMRESEKKQRKRDNENGIGRMRS